MAGDATTVRTLVNNKRDLVLLLTNVSDGTGETAAIKADLSALRLHNGEVPDHLTLVSAHWTISGFQLVKLAFDHDADDVAAVLGCQQGKLCLKDVGGLQDPQSAGGTGDLVLTTGPVAAGITGTYTIKLHLRMAA